MYEGGTLMKKHIAILLAALMILSTLIGCGQSTNADLENMDAVKTDSTTNSTTNNTDGADVKKEDIKEETARKDQIAIYACKEDKGVRSAVITFDTNKLRIHEEQRKSNTGTKFELIGDGSTISVRCKAETVQALYDDTMSHYHGDDYSISELAEKTIGDRTYKCWDMLWDGKVTDSFYAYEMANGLVVTNAGSGYDDDANFEEMVSAALVGIEEGDGTTFYPPIDIQVENDDSVMVITFDNGDIFSLDYNEPHVALDASRQVIQCDFYDEQGEYRDNIQLELFISDRYATLQEYLNEEFGWNAEYFQFSDVSYNGVEVSIAQNPEYGEGLCWIDIPGDYVIRGRYYTDPENMVTLENALALVFGAEIQEAVVKEEEGVSEYIAYSDNTGKPAYRITYDSAVVEYDMTSPEYAMCVVRFKEDSEGYFRIDCLFDCYESYDDYSRFKPQDYEGNSIYANSSVARKADAEYGELTAKLLEITYTDTWYGTDGVDTCFWIDTETGGNIAGTVRGMALEDADVILEAMFKELEIVE